MWKLRDIILMVVLAIVCGFLYRLWDWLYTFVNITWVPGQGFFNGLWFWGGLLVPIIIRRPGAALLAEFIAAAVELGLAGNWGAATLLSGLLQGLGAEIGFAVFRYKKFGLGPVALAGALSGIAFLPQWWTAYDGSTYTAGVQTLYVIFTIVSGAVVGGWISQAIANAMQRTGVLRNFEIGRQAKVSQ